MIMKSDIRSIIAFALAATLLVALLLCIACTIPQATQTPQPNRPPVIQQFTGISDWSAATAGDITCSASDPDGDNLTYSWAADNGTIKGAGPIISWTSPATMGKYNITVTVSDGKGGEASRVQEVRVLINADAPIVLKMSLPSKETVTGAKRVRAWLNSPIECIVEGTDAKDLKYSWTAANGTLRAGTGFSLESGTASKVNWLAPGAGGDYTVNVKVTDGSGNEANGQVNFKVVCCTTE